MDWRGPATEKRSSSFETDVQISCIPGRKELFPDSSSGHCSASPRGLPQHRILRQLKTGPLVFQVLFHLLVKPRAKSAAAALLLGSKYKICPSLPGFPDAVFCQHGLCCCQPHAKDCALADVKAGATSALFSL